MADFNYNAADSINRYLEKASSGIGGVFAHIVESKRKDNELAEKTYLNLENLKKDVSIWGQKKITEEINRVKEEASKKIYKNGKLNHEYIGELTNEVSKIKDLKNFYNTTPELFKLGTEALVANKDNIDSFSAAQSDLTALMLSGEATNAVDLQKKMSKVIDNHTNFNSIGLKAFLAANPLETSKYTETYVDKNGNESKELIEFEAPKYYTFNAETRTPEPPKTISMPNPTTGKMEEVPFARYAAASMKASRPDIFDKIREKGNFGIAISDEQIAENILRSVKTPKAAVETKDIYQMQSEKAKATTDVLEANAKPQEIADKHAVAMSQVRENEAQRLKALRGDSGGTSVPGLKITPRKIPLKDKNGKVIPGKYQTAYDMTLPKPFAMDFPGVKGGKGYGSQIGPIKVVSVTKGVDGRYILNGYPVDKAKIDPSNPFADVPTTSNKLTNVILGQSEYDAFINRVQGDSKENTASIMGGLQRMSANTVDSSSFFGTGR